jgi:hypothetical protein
LKDEEADIVAYLEEALLQNGYPERVIDAIIQWYVNQP